MTSNSPPTSRARGSKRTILIGALVVGIAAVAALNFWPESGSAPRDAFEAASSVAGDIAGRTPEEELNPAPQAPTPTAPARLQRR